MDEAALAAFQQDVEEVRERLPVPGFSIAVARDGRILWSAGYGVANAATGRAAEPGTPYRIASITKPMTAAVLLQLVERGELELDVPVARYLEDPPDWARESSVGQVLSHTSEGPASSGVFTYSGRYNVLGAVAEAAAGRPFEALLAEEVFEPAGMRSTVPAAELASEPSVAERLAAPHGDDGEPVGQRPVLRTTGGNGVVSTVEDLVRFVDAVADGDLFDPRLLEEAWAPAGTGAEPTPYGLGWFVERTPAATLVWHGGQWPTYSGLLLHVPDEELTLAVLGNSWHLSRPYYQIGTATTLYNPLAASFLRHFVLPDELGPVPDVPWDASADSLVRIAASLEPPRPLYWGAELFGRGLLARAGGRTERADSLMSGVADCCRPALAAAADLGLLFHLARSESSALRAIGQTAGERRLLGYPDDPVTRFHLGVAYVEDDPDRAGALLESVIDDPEAPAWLAGWAGYARAEQLADTDPERAAELLEGVVDRGVDEGGLLEDARSLLEELRG